MEKKRAVCIAASNRMKGGDKDVSYHICEMAAGIFGEKGISCEVLDLRRFSLFPCVECGECCAKKECAVDGDFNRIYQKMLTADYIFFVSPCYASIPSKLCILLEKMAHLTSQRMGESVADGTAQGLCALVGIISYSMEGVHTPGECKAMVNDTIYSILCSTRLRTVPFNLEWDTGIFLPIAGEQAPCKDPEAGQERENREKLSRYVEVVVQTARSLHAIC